MLTTDCWLTDSWADTSSLSGSLATQQPLLCYTESWWENCNTCTHTCIIGVTLRPQILQEYPRCMRCAEGRLDLVTTLFQLPNYSLVFCVHTVHDLCMKTAFIAKCCICIADISTTCYRHGAHPVISEGTRDCTTCTCSFSSKVNSCVHYHYIEVAIYNVGLLPPVLNSEVFLRGSLLSGVPLYLYWIRDLFLFNSLSDWCSFWSQKRRYSTCTCSLWFMFS